MLQAGQETFTDFHAGDMQTPEGKNLMIDVQKPGSRECASRSESTRSLSLSSDFFRVHFLLLFSIATASGCGLTVDLFADDAPSLAANVSVQAAKLKPVSATSTSSATAGKIDIEKSRVYIFVDKTGLGHQHAVEGKLSGGAITLGATEAAGELVFDMKSFDADSDAARRYLGLSGFTDGSTRQQVNQNMRAASILNIGQFPTATFSIASVTDLNRKSRNGNPLYEFQGELTLRGARQPVKFEAEVSTKDGMSNVKGQFAVMQTQFGMTPFRKAFGAVGVANRLVIHGDLWLIPETADADSAQ